MATVCKLSHRQATGQGFQTLRKWRSYVQMRQKGNSWWNEEEPWSSFSKKKKKKPVILQTQPPTSCPTLPSAKNKWLLPEPEPSKYRQKGGSRLQSPRIWGGLKGVFPACKAYETQYTKDPEIKKNNTCILDSLGSLHFSSQLLSHEAFWSPLKPSRDNFGQQDSLKWAKLWHKIDSICHLHWKLCLPKTWQAHSEVSCRKAPLLIDIE